VTLLTLVETAARFRVSRRTLQGQLDGVPYLCVGRKKLFDDIAIAALVEKFRYLSSSSPQKLAARRTGALGAPNTGSALTEALRLLTNPPRPSYSNNGETKRSASTLRRRTKRAALASPPPPSAISARGVRSCSSSP
jgi:hypothetical protein